LYNHAYRSRAAMLLYRSRAAMLLYRSRAAMLLYRSRAAMVTGIWAIEFDIQYRIPNLFECIFFKTVEH
jgi:hypothetical protein